MHISHCHYAIINIPIIHHKSISNIVKSNRLSIVYNFHGFVLPMVVYRSKQFLRKRVTTKTCRVYNLTFELGVHDPCIVTSILELISKSYIFCSSFKLRSYPRFTIKRIRKKIVQISIPFSTRYSSHILFDKNSNELGLKGLHRVKDSFSRISVSTFDVRHRRWYNDEHVKNS